MAAPGVPDFYQDTTRWNLRLVDPDNRFPPDPANLEVPGQFDPEMLENWQDGRIKAWLIARSLCFRKRHPELFTAGEYLPLAGSERAAEHVIAFARCRGEAFAIAIVPRFVSGFSALEKYPIGGRIWHNAYVTLPEAAPARWTNVLTGETVQTALAAEQKVIYVSDALQTFPAALLSNL